MTCPSCGCKNSTEYDDDTFHRHRQCSDCGWIYKGFISGDCKHESRTGFAKIISMDLTDEYYGSNGKMKRIVNNDKVYRYKTAFVTARDGEKRIAYRIAPWVWDKEDLLMVDVKGNDLTDCEIIYPKPQQFNSKFLDV